MCGGERAPACASSALCWRSQLALPLQQKSRGIQSMAIRHFGELLRDMSQYKWMLNNVVLEGLVPLVLFLGDRDVVVVKVRLGSGGGSAC